MIFVVIKRYFNRLMYVHLKAKKQTNFFFVFFDKIYVTKQLCVKTGIAIPIRKNKGGVPMLRPYFSYSCDEGPI